MNAIMFSQNTVVRMFARFVEIIVVWHVVSVDLDYNLMKDWKMMWNIDIQKDKESKCISCKLK